MHEAGEEKRGWVEAARLPSYDSRGPTRSHRFTCNKRDLSPVLPSETFVEVFEDAVLGRLFGCCHGANNVSRYGMCF